jgi:hypothetical protein
LRALAPIVISNAVHGRNQSWARLMEALVDISLSHAGGSHGPPVKVVAFACSASVIFRQDRQRQGSPGNCHHCQPPQLGHDPAGPSIVAACSGLTASRLSQCARIGTDNADIVCSVSVLPGSSSENFLIRYSFVVLGLVGPTSPVSIPLLISFTGRF